MVLGEVFGRDGQPPGKLGQRCRTGLRRGQIVQRLDGGSLQASDLRADAAEVIQTMNQRRRLQRRRLQTESLE